MASLDAGVSGYVSLHAYVLVCTCVADSKVAAAREQLAMLTHRRETQEISAADAERMRNDRSALMERIRTVISAREVCATMYSTGNGNNTKSVAFLSMNLYQFPMRSPFIYP